MVTSAKEAIGALYGAHKATATALALFTVLSGVVLSLSGYIELPGVVHDHEGRIVNLEEFKRFQGCWMLEQAANRDPNPCRYLLTDPDEFRPPFTPVQP